MTNKEVIERLKAWLHANIEEQDMSSELKLDNARLIYKIQEWEKE